MRNYEIWRNELVSEIRTIADSKELERLWSGLDPHAISSFAEELAHVFDDYAIDEFILAGHKKVNLHYEQFNALCRFRDRFAAYLQTVAPTPPTSVEYKTVLADPQWGEVTKTAREFITLFDI